MSPNVFSIKDKKICVAGETGLVGRALTQELKKHPCKILSAPHGNLDLTNQEETYSWLSVHKPDAIIMAAGRVGGIGANASNQAAFLHENLAMAQNVIHGAHQAGIARLLYLGSSCIYPKHAKQPITEDALLTGALEPTNEGYALAKIAGLKLCQYYAQQYGRFYVAAMPTNLYGPNDHFDAEKSHVIPALILKIHRAKIERLNSVTLWGTGSPLREFLYIDDLAKGIVHVLKNYDEQSAINIGSEDEISIQRLAMMIACIIGYDGAIEFDTSKPDGTMRKKLDNSKINALGWTAQTTLKDGLEKTYQWFLQHKA